MSEREIQRVYNYPIHPRDSKIDSDKGFVNTDNGQTGGTHWTCFIKKVKNHSTLTRLVFSLIYFY